MSAPKHTAGPFCLNEKPTEMQVQGRHGAIVQRYPLTDDGRACAAEDLRRRQCAWTAAEQRIRYAAPDLLEALQRLSALTPGAANAATARDLHLTVKAIADEAIAKATGEGA